MSRSEKFLEILSSDRQHAWHRIGSSIWTLDSEDNTQETTLAVARTLFDQPRWLEPRHLYDERGSHLFEQICQLPEYYLTRTEETILAKEAHRLIAAAPVRCIVELGAGFSKKTLHLLREQSRQRRGGVYAPIDVSLAALRAAREAVRRQVPHMTFHGLHVRYEEGIASIEKRIPTLFVFLGSSIGNFTASDFSRFFQFLSNCMGPDDYFLLGVDRIKSVEILERAYNDSQNVTANFILNVFNRVNSLTGSNFDPNKMSYYSCYNEAWQQIEMYAISTFPQKISFPSLGSSFLWKKGDRILVETSRKFEPLQLQKQLQFFHLKLLEHLTDPKEWFSVMLFQKKRIVR